MIMGQGEAVADMARTSGMLPASAEDRQEVRFEYQAIANATYGIQAVSYSYSVSNWVKTQQTSNAAHTRVTSNPTVDAVSDIITIAGIAVEGSANDMAKPPKCRSPDVPDLKSWEPWAKGRKRMGKIFSVIGNGLGIVSAGIDLGQAFSKAKGGDWRGAAVSFTKGAIDLAFSQ